MLYLRSSWLHRMVGCKERANQIRVFTVWVVHMPSSPLQTWCVWWQAVNFVNASLWSVKCVGLWSDSMSTDTFTSILKIVIPLAFLLLFLTTLLRKFVHSMDNAVQKLSTLSSLLRHLWRCLQLARHYTVIGENVFETFTQCFLRARIKSIGQLDISNAQLYCTLKFVLGRFSFCNVCFNRNTSFK